MAYHLVDGEWVGGYHGRTGNEGVLVGMVNV
jgi:hypothetical protein